MNIKLMAAFAVAIIGLATPAQAKHHHRHHVASQAVTHCVYDNSPVIVCSGSEKRTTAHLRKRDANGNRAEEAASSKYCHVQTDAGEIVIACWMKDKMAGFIGDVVARGFKGRIKCFSLSHSHVAGSLHFIAEACDFAQRGWGKTVQPMYHVGDLARKWGLRDGCTFRDCGHIDSGRTAAARAHARRRMAMR